jgi:c-di-GMP-binding flagellar brake protein YcgR
MSEEKRKAVRLRRQLFIQYGFKINDQQKWDIGTLRDISEIGMCFITSRSFSIGWVLDLRVKFPSDPSLLLEIKGKVVASKGSLSDTYMTRVEFFGLDEKQKKAVQVYIQSYSDPAEYTGVERRRNPRINSNFVVSYRMLEEKDNVDISQTKNLSLGGMLLTTNRLLAPGTKLALEIRLPAALESIRIIGEVVDAREVVKGVIYDTRIKFLTVDENYLKSIRATVDYYFKKG